MIFCAALALVLSSCQTRSYLGNESSPYYVVPAGSRLTLNQELTIPSDELAVYMQNGRVMRNVDLLHEVPFCKFELRDLSRAARKVQPDEMVVTGSTQARSRGVTALAAPIVVAELGSVMLAGTDDVPSIESFSTRMDLRSDKQPEIFRLTCAQWGQPGAVQHVTITEMRQALTGLFTLRLPQQEAAGRS
jgi:hypothetical protein